MAHVMKILARGFASTSAQCSIQHVTVIGGGLMGSGIAQVTAQAGQNVTIVETSDALLGKAKDRIQASLQRVAKAQLKKKGEDPSKGEAFVKDFVQNIMSRVSFSTDLPSAVKSTDLVVEAIIENLAIKQDLFQTLDSTAPEHTLMATNTSSLLVGEIGAKLKRKDKYGGLHFFNPVPVMKLLEVVKTDEMSNETYAALMAWGQSVGKTCITCKDTPGFVVNRLLIPFQAEAIRLLERGVASARDIDLAMKLGAGHPMGPFELTDYTGLDTAKLIIDAWHQKFPDDETFKPSETINKLVREGKYGVKSGEGFYKHWNSTGNITCKPGEHIN